MADRVVNKTNINHIIPTIVHAFSTARGITQRGGMDAGVPQQSIRRAGFDL